MKAARQIQTDALKSGRVIDKQSLDAFTNALARVGFGTSNLLEGTNYVNTRFTRQYNLIQALYRSNWIARKVVDCPAEDMLKNWLTIDSELSPEDIDKFDRKIDLTGTHEKLLQAIKWGRLFGGAGAVIIIKGQGNQLDRLLDPESIEIGAYQGLLSFDRWSGITPSAEINGNIENPLEFGLPEYYTVTTETAKTFRVHASRVLRFIGRDVPQWEWQAEQRWGISEYEVMYDELKKRDNTSWNIASLVFRANILALKQKSLSEMLSGIGKSPAAQQQFYNTLSAQTQLMSNQGMMVLPEDGGLETHQYSFGGINDIYVSFMLDICGATEIPMSRLFGRSSSGLSGTNEGDEHSYYDLISAKQKRELNPQLKKLFPIIMMSELGEIPDDLDWHFNPVRSMSNEEMAELASKKTTAIVEGFNAGLYGQKTGLKELKAISEETGMFSNITDKMIKDASDETVSPMDELAAATAGPPEGGDDPTGKGEIPATPNSKPKKSKGEDSDYQAKRDLVRQSTMNLNRLTEEKERRETAARKKDIKIGLKYIPPPGYEVVGEKVIWRGPKDTQDHEFEGRYAGLKIVIENLPGTTRSGVDLKGDPWAVTMTYPYGYVGGTRGTDGDEVDCFLGPFEEVPTAFAVHTQNPITGKADEDKLMLGWPDVGSALNAFFENYSSPAFFRSVEAIPMRDLPLQLKRLRGKKLKAVDAAAA